MRRTYHLKNLIDQIDSQKFIEEHLQDSVAKLLFKYSNDSNRRLLIEQIASRQAIRKKLPSYYQNLDLILAPKQNLEQSTNEAIAKFRATLLGGGKSLVDLSAGFGVDFRFLVEHFEEAKFVEPNLDLLDFSRINLSQLLPEKKIAFFNQSAEEFLLHDSDSVDLIFIDPSRRDETHQRVINLDDYSPNLFEILEPILKRSKRLYVKLSPMLSIVQLLKDFSDLSEIWVLSERNECKELGLLFDPSIGKSNTLLRTFDLQKDEVLAFEAPYANRISIDLEEPMDYVYLPNSSILKADLQDHCASKFDLSKLDTNSNLYTSNRFITSFPGRKFKVINKLKPYDKSLMKGAYQVISRNFPDKAQQIEAKLKLKPKSGAPFIIATKVKSKPEFLLCEWIFN